MKIIKPLKLKPGDKVGIISPSEPIIYKKKFLSGVETLKKLGFRVVLGKNAFENYSGYMAGSEKERAADLNGMFRNKKIKGIFISHGGFNSNRLLNLIDYELIKKNPKVFMGFSDITVLLNAIYAKTGLVTFHGQNIEYGFSRGLGGKYKYTRDYFEKAVMSNKSIGLIKQQQKLEILRAGKTKGILVGGNLTVLMTLLGTDYEPDWKGKILFWEELGETIQDIDFYLTHLRLCRVFDKISGMAIGQFKVLPLGDDNPDLKNQKTFSVNKIILDICKNYKFPIIKNIAFGHIYPQVTIPIGVKATIDTSKKLFSIDESGVK